MFVETGQILTSSNQTPDSNRPLEPIRALAIDPDGTIEVDDAISVVPENILDQNSKSLLVTVYIADVALCNSQDIFRYAQRKIRTDYSNQANVDYMLPLEVIEAVSLGNDQRHGSPAIAIRTRVSDEGMELTSIDRVRVGVDCLTYSEFGQLLEAKDPRALSLQAAAKTIRSIGRYAVSGSGNDPHSIVATPMVMVNNLMAEYVLGQDLEDNWLFRGYDGLGKQSRGNRASNRARGFYSTNPRQHAGIRRGREKTIYSHFTSPIRRLADYTVHCVLASEQFGDSPLSLGKRGLKKVAERSNWRERTSSALHT